MNFILKTVVLFLKMLTCFCFGGNALNQVDRVVMGCPLGPALCNFFMGYNEQKRLKSNNGRLVKFYRRYADDILFLFENEHQALTFLEFFNIQHPNLSFTIKK